MSQDRQSSHACNPYVLTPGTRNQINQLHARCLGVNHSTSNHQRTSERHLAPTSRANVRTALATRVALLATVLARRLMIDQTPDGPAVLSTRHDLEGLAHAIQRVVDSIARLAASKLLGDAVSEQLHPHVVRLARRGGQVDANEVAHVAEDAVVGNAVAVLGTSRQVFWVSLVRTRVHMSESGKMENVPMALATARTSTLR
jgi:hypothetical protein